MKVARESFVVCALPRSGARLLAGSLRALGVAAPEPRFWWGWPGHDPGTREPLRRGGAALAAPGVLEALRGAGTDGVGRFGVEAQWHELEQVTAALRLQAAAPAGVATTGEGAIAGLSPSPVPSDHELLRGFLPDPRYVHLTREDKVAQAVAWWRAGHARDRVITGAGTPVQGDGPGGRGRLSLVAPPAPDLDPVAVEQLEQRLRADEWRWLSYFARAGVEPLVVSYEALRDDHAATVRRVLDFIAVPGAATVEIPPPVLAADPGVDQGRVDYQTWRRRRRSGGGHDATAPVSVVVTGGDSEERCAGARAVRASVADDVEVVVVAAAGGAHDAPPAPGEVAGVRTVRPHAPITPAAARNFGAAETRGETVVFLDAGARPRSGWLEPLRDALTRPAVAVVGPAVLTGAGAGPAAFGLTWQDCLLRPLGLEQRPRQPAPVPFLASCLAFRRRDFQAVGGFDIGMMAPGSEDAEICLHLWRRGRSCLVVPGAEVCVDRPVGAGDRWPGPGPEASMHDALRLATTHFGTDTLLRAFDRATGREAFNEAYARLVCSDVFERRRRIDAESVHDAGWFLDRFAIEVFR